MPIARFEGDTVLIANPGEPMFVITRTFNAPARLVWEAWTNPEYMRRWYGTSCMTLDVCEMDVRVGGKWRRTLRGNDGQVFGWHGEYRELDFPVRVVFSEVFEPVPDHPSVVTVTMREENGKTHVRVEQLHDSVASRDAHIASGMEPGMRETLDRLETFLVARS
jgi:uncharacterized protein YndB with AHSA1/START domain